MKRGTNVEASLNEIVLSSFRVDEEGFRDIDSIVRQRCREMDPDASVEYCILRKDSLRYRTEDIEDLIKERNGDETRIRNVTMTARTEDPRRLQFVVEFSKDLRITGEASDRANLVLLASDVRALVRERMKSRTAISDRARYAATLIALLLGCAGYFVFSTSYTNNFNTKSNQLYNRSQAAQGKENLGEISSYKAMLRRYGTSIPSASQSAQLAFLVQDSLLVLRTSLAYDQSSQSSYDIDSQEAWWGDSIYLLFASGILLAGLVRGVSYLLYPRTGAAFLIGDEVRREARNARWRERIIWGIGVTFLLGIASGIVVSAVG